MDFILENSGLIGIAVGFFIGSFSCKFFAFGKDIKQTDNSDNSKNTKINVGK